MEKKMNSKHQFEDWIYEKLYEAIMQAIAQSKEVEDVLKSLESRGLTQKMAAFNLILCLEISSVMIELIMQVQLHS